MKIIFEKVVYELTKTEKKNFIVQRPFMIIDKSFVPVKDIDIYEAEVLKKIIDKRGREVPILKLKTHTCSVCGGKCICGKFVYHQFEEVNKTNDEFEIRIRKCKKCGYTERKEIKHDFVLKNENDLELVCESCKFRRKVKNDDEIKKFAIPPFPLERVLSFYNLNIEKIKKLQKKIDELLKKEPLMVVMEEKLKRSHDLWEGTRFYKYRELISSITGIVFNSGDEPDDLWIKGNKIYIGISNDSTILGEVIETFYKKKILYEFPSEEELSKALDIYDEEETKRLVAEYDEKYKEYQKDMEQWEKEFNEKVVNSDEYKNLRKFLTSRYGVRICYAVDPYEGYFSGTAIPHRDIVWVFFEGVKKLGLLKEVKV